MQVGLVGAVIYDTGVVEIYDSSLSEIRVKGEEWELWQGTKKATLNAPIIWSVVENSIGVYITREQTTSKPDGSLKIVYGFIVGGKLKHTVIWTSTDVATVTVQVKQVHLMDFDKVTTDTGTSTASMSEKSTAYLFGYGSKGFWLFENQYAMVYNTKSLEPTLLTEKCLQSGEIDFAGKKVTYTFGDWTLASGGSLVVDPDSATLNDPTEDGDVQFHSGEYHRNVGGTSVIQFGNQGVDYNYRGFIEWPVTSIPDTATITNTIFKYHGIKNTVDAHIHAMASRPSIQADTHAGNGVIYNDAGDGTVYVDEAGFPVVGTNKQIDLGAAADTALQNSLANDWFAIGLQADSEGGVLWDRINAEETASTPDPTLYVEYDLGGPTPGWNKLQYFTEPPTGGAFNKLKFASEPPIAGAWNKVLYSTE